MFYLIEQIVLGVIAALFVVGVLGGIALRVRCDT
jgi:hypothetical protein